MKIVVIGAKGMLGQDLVRVLRGSGHETLDADIEDVDITKTDDVSRFMAGVRPDWVVLSAAFTQVDRCESEVAAARAVNVDGARHVAIACREVGARLCYVSTDYVFDGTNTTPYTEDDVPNPQSVYGQTKLAGEIAVRRVLDDALVIRTSWLYGLGGRNFVEAIVDRAKRGDALRVVTDQEGAPTYTPDLADGIAQLLALQGRGIVNVTNTGSCTWHAFARCILDSTGFEHMPIESISSHELENPAKRPANSRLCSDRYAALTGSTLRMWDVALTDYLQARPER